MIRLEDIHLTQGEFKLENIDLEIPAGTYGVLMGRSGCGKTTLLELVCGLRPLASGRVFIHDKEVTSLSPKDRGVGYVPQDQALFPTRRVREQLGFALTLKGESAFNIAARIEEMAKLLDISHLLERKPHDLSGGEAQRVALGRALSGSPAVLCLDEPLSALDEALHEEMCELLATIHHNTGVTILHITHSSREANRLGQRVFRMTGGKIREGLLSEEAAS